MVGVGCKTYISVTVKINNFPFIVYVLLEASYNCKYSTPSIEF